MKWFGGGEDQHIFLTICSDSDKASKEVISHWKVCVFRIDKNLEKIKYIKALDSCQMAQLQQRCYLEVLWYQE